MPADETEFFRLLTDDFAQGEAVGRDSMFADDLGLDSLSMLELRCVLESAAGREVPDEMWNEINTAGELYDWIGALGSHSRK